MMMMISTAFLVANGTPPTAVVRSVLCYAGKTDDTLLGIDFFRVGESGDRSKKHALVHNFHKFPLIKRGKILQNDDGGFMVVLLHHVTAGVIHEDELDGIPSR